ncbi:MAG: hypothetical protein ACKVGW_20595 [Verrucomicrobiia bacterium]
MKSKILLFLILPLSSMPIMFAPPGGPPANLPDNGPTISLLAIALVGLIVASKKRFLK